MNKAIELDNSDGYMYYYKVIAKNKLWDNTSACSDLKKVVDLGYDEANVTLKEICKWKLNNMGLDKYEKLKELKTLLDKNLITQDEFQLFKEEVLYSTEKQSQNGDVDIKSTILKRKTTRLLKNIVFFFLLIVCFYYGFNFVKSKKLENILKSRTTLINDSIIIKKNDFSAEPNDDNLNSLKKFNDVQLTLIDASLKKAKLYLGEPDKIGLLYMGGSEKNAAIYLNKVNDNGVTKHLVLFLRYYTVEEIYAIRDNEKAYFGIHYVEVRNNNFYSNSVFFDKY